MCALYVTKRGTSSQGRFVWMSDSLQLSMSGVQGVVIYWVIGLVMYSPAVQTDYRVQVGFRHQLYCRKHERFNGSSLQDVGNAL